MAHLRRVVLILILALAILSPFVATGFDRMHSAKTSTPPTLQLAQFGSRVINAASAKNHPTDPIQAVGTRDTLWIMQPALADGNTKCFQVLAHAADARENGKDLWLVVHDGTSEFLPDLPSQMVIQVPPFGGDLPSSIAVFFKPDESHPENGRRVVGYSTSEEYELPVLPEGQRVMAAAGGGMGSERLVFALTLGAPITSTQPATQPATRAATTLPTSQPATAPAEQWSLLQRVGTKWIPLPALGAPGDDSPTPNARIAMAIQQERLWLLWVDPDAKNVLKLKPLAWRGGKMWSPTLSHRIREPITRMQVVNVPQMIVLWPVKPEGKSTVSLHGISLSPEGNIDVDAKGDVRMMSMDLGDDSDGILPERDVAAAQLGNSIAVIVKDKKDAIHELLFSADGRQSGPSVLVDPSPGNGKISPLQDNGRLFVLMVLMALSLWYWRRQPALISLPAGVKMAALGQRLAAGVIDAIGPLVIVVLTFHLYDKATFDEVWPHILQVYQIVTPEQAKILVWFMALYVGHVTISEMVSGRSLGKMVFGLKVVGLDGRAAGPGPVLIRNIIRIAEWMFPPVLLVPVLTPFRQRIGDIVARTLVVQMHTLPPEPDKDDPAAKT